jgi:hypothetical protein
MLSNVNAVGTFVEAMEVRFLANPDANLRFVLLTDFLDAREQALPEDEEALAGRARAIGSLSAKYAAPAPSDQTDIFFAIGRACRSQGGCGWVTSASAESSAI